MKRSSLAAFVITAVFATGCGGGGGTPQAQQPPSGQSATMTVSAPTPTTAAMQSAPTVAPTSAAAVTTATVPAPAPAPTETAQTSAGPLVTPAATPGVLPPEPAGTARPDENDGATPVTAGPGLMGLESYRFDLRMEVTSRRGQNREAESVVIRNKGEVVNPDRYHGECDATIQSLTLEEEAIAIGDRVWVRNSQTNDEYVRRQPQFCKPDLSPQELMEDLDTEDLGALRGKDETVNGVEAVRYSLDRETARKLMDLGGALGQGDNADGEALPRGLNFEFDLWLAKDGNWPTRLEMNMSGRQAGQQIRYDIRFDVTDPNAEDIRIEAPTD